MDALNDGLNEHERQAGSSILLGVVLGLMMAFDMGGPLNKTAYLFATTGLGAAATATDAPQLKIMAAVMIAGMVPPLGLALATVVRPRLFTPPSGRTARRRGSWARRSSPRGRSRSRPPTRCGSSRRSWPAARWPAAWRWRFDVTLRAPHGGIFVLFAVDTFWLPRSPWSAGTLVAAACVVALKTASGGEGRDRGDSPTRPPEAIRARRTNHSLHHPSPSTPGTPENEGRTCPLIPRPAGSAPGTAGARGARP